MTVHYLPTERRKSDRSLGVTTHEELKDSRLNYQLRVLELTEMLNRKVDLELLLECFFIELQAIVGFEGLLHVPADSNYGTLIGDQRQHCVQFALNLGELDLGEIVFYSAKGFSSREDRELERLVHHLLYPLRNALIHDAEVQLSLTDEFTGLQNRAAMDKQLPREIVLSRRSEIPLSVMLLDIDHFSALNEHHGHDVANKALIAASVTLANTLRKGDMIFRYDTDTFVVVLSGTEYEGAKILAERIRTAIDRCFSYQNVQVVLSASAGITELVDDDDAESVMERASMALLNAKRAGRNTLRAVDKPATIISLV